MIENTFGKNIIPENDEARLKALSRYRIMDSPSEDSFDNIASLAAQIFNVPISLLSLVDTDRVFFKANIGMGNSKEANRGKSLCALAVLDENITVFEDALKEPCLISNPNVAGNFGLRFYAGAPLITHDGFLIGTLCIIDKQPRQFSATDSEVLQKLARTAMDQIELRLAALDELEKHQTINKELVNQKEEIQAINDQLIASNKDLLELQETLTHTKNSLQIAVNAASLGSFDMDLNSGQMYTSDQCKRNFGLPHDAPLHHKELFEAILPEHREMVEKNIAEAFKNKTDYVAEYPIRWPDNSIHWISAHGRPVFEDNKPVRMVGVTQKITERKLFDQRKDDFLSIASHELKTPVTSLKASLQLMERLKDKPGSPILPKLIEQASKNVEKVASMIDDLLNVTQLADGGLRLDKTSFVISEMLVECCNHVRLAGEYELILEGDKQLSICADEHRIDQVVVNFVNNAVKYAPNCKKIYLIIEQEGDYAKVSVKDSGPGIDKELLPHLFERYYRIDKSGKTYTGLGLGLYICSEIIKKHNGKIGVDSEIGQGSTFWFTLPLK